MTTGDDSHLSIGEVLAALRDEFPDVTISKIRFLESQGLIDPERTPSGYRKFYGDDLNRLRWILFQQKENFLPLKVIKERLEQLRPDELTLLEPAGSVPEREAGSVPEREAGSVPDAGGSPPTSRDAVPVGAGDADSPARAGTHSRRGAARTRTPAFAPTLPLDDGGDDARVVSGAGDVEQLYTRDALRAAAGLDGDQLGSLERFGLITPAREAGGDVQFDADALETARIAAGFFARGVEARHLRMYRSSAEREALLFAQVLLPYQRQRNPESRARLQDELVELAGLGRRLRTVLLREAARETLAE